MIYLISERFRFGIRQWCSALVAALMLMGVGCGGAEVDMEKPTVEGGEGRAVVDALQMVDSGVSAAKDAAQNTESKDEPDSGQDAGEDAAVIDGGDSEAGATQDAGTDSEPDSGQDAGEDAAIADGGGPLEDAAQDGGTGSEPDSGQDTGEDAAIADGGDFNPDGGVDAGNDTTLPDTIITSAPPENDASANGSFRFDCTEPGCTFECKLDSQQFMTCASPKNYSGLADGAHVFEVRAAGANGNVDSTPAAYAWSIDTTRPDTTIASKPTNPTNSTGASFMFSSSEQGGSFECKLDSGVYETCTSPKNYTGLSDGIHVFEVRAKDAAGNLDLSPAQWPWVIDAISPDTSITAKPGAFTNQRTAAFSFACSEQTGTFECKLDAGAYEPCSSPKEYPGLADGAHMFEVRAKDSAGNLDVSPAQWSWNVDGTSPETAIASKPSNPTNSTGVSFTFSSSEQGGSFECKLDSGVYEICSSPKDYANLADGIHVFEVRAKDAAGNSDLSPAQWLWTIDAVSPDTSITAKPGAFTNQRTAAFSFACTEQTCTFECKLDAGAYEPCSSPKEYPGLADGTHIFEVRAKDGAGNIDLSSAQWMWNIDGTAPETAIAAKPTNPTNSTSAGFTFSSPEPGASFECKLDSGVYEACTSPKNYAGLSDGIHVFEVRAKDGAGNFDTSPAQWSWNIDGTFPETTIVSKPANPTSLRTATFTFSCSESACTFECKLDNGPVETCTSPKDYSNLAGGAHAFEVRAIDAVTNADPIPAVFNWSIDITPPDTTILSHPANPSDSPDAVFDFTCTEPPCSFECKLDTGGFAPCVSPQSYSWLANSPHVFEVRAKDALGNLDTSPASFAWIVSVTSIAVEWVTPPPVVMESGFDNLVEYGVSGGIDAYHNIECQSDGEPWWGWQQCSGGQSGTGLFGATLNRFACSVMVWRFRVRADVLVGGDWVPFYSEEKTSTVNPPTGNVLRASHSSMTFTGAEGGADPPVQTLQLSEGCGASIPWTASSDAAWLLVAPATGATDTGGATVSVDTSGLAAGTYNATITVTSSAATNGPLSIPVELRVVGGVAVEWVTPPPVVMESGFDNLVEYGVSGGIDAYHNIECQSDGEPWWGWQPCSGSQSGTGLFGATLNRFACSVMVWRFRVRADVFVGGDWFTLYTEEKTSTINPPMGNVLRASPTNMNFTGADGGADPPVQTLQLSEGCGASIPWSASSDAAWLLVAPTSGTTYAEATVSVDTSGLVGGTYNATITVTSSAATNSPLSIPVELRVVGGVAVEWVTPPPVVMESGFDNLVEYGVSGGIDAYHRYECHWDGEPWWQQCGGEQSGMGLFGGILNILVCSVAVLHSRVRADVFVGGDWFTLYTEEKTSTINPPMGNVLRASPTNMNFTGADGGADPPVQTLQLSEGCGASIPWSASSDAAWLLVAPTSGTTYAEATVSVDTSGLVGGTYNATITVTSSAATNSPLSIPVELRVVGGGGCAADADCPEGTVCIDGFCVGP